MILNKNNIYATCVDYRGNGILIIGHSGSGKSDLALRLIMDKEAKLVADDRTDIFNKNGKLKASCPEAIIGKMEVRGLGICQFPPCPETEIKLVVELVDKEQKIERLPEFETVTLCDVKVPKIQLYAFYSSSVDKVILACTACGKMPLLS